MLLQKGSEGRGTAAGKQDTAIDVSLVELNDSFAASSAGCHDMAVISDSRNGDNVGFAVFQHLGDRRDLGAKAEAATKVDTNSGVNIAFRCQYRRSDCPRSEVPAQSKFTLNAFGGFYQLFIVEIHFYLCRHSPSIFCENAIRGRF